MPGTYSRYFAGDAAEDVRRMCLLPVFRGSFGPGTRPLVVDFRHSPTVGVGSPYGVADRKRGSRIASVFWRRGLRIAEVRATILHELVHLCGRSGCWGRYGCEHTRRFKRTFARAALEAWGVDVDAEELDRVRAEHVADGCPEGSVHLLDRLVVEGLSGLELAADGRIPVREHG